MCIVYYKYVRQIFQKEKIRCFFFVVIKRNNEVYVFKKVVQKLYMYVKILDMDMYIVYYRYKIDRYFKREYRDIFFF